ncbi:MAG TPA: hypothetical protein V6D47_16895 [Oscillatoriaceae cyanobacterium]
MVLSAAAFLLGLAAVFAAIRMRWPLAQRLGTGWLLRFGLVQGVLINGVLLAVVLALVKGYTWAASPVVWVVPLAYAGMFYWYSLANITWTAQKFHGG